MPERRVANGGAAEAGSGSRDTESDTEVVTRVSTRMHERTTDRSRDRRMDQAHPSGPRALRGMTIVEILAVVGVIVLLLGILLPAVNLARRNALWGRSQANLRQVGQLLVLYATDNRDSIVPTAFDYRDPSTPSIVNGKPRSVSPPGTSPPIGAAGYGSWTDILWTTGGFGPVGSIGESTGPYWDYRYDSPDAALYAQGWDGTNPFRSAEVMEKTVGGDGATPFGTGATDFERGELGYFGGNPFFDARPPTSATPYAGKWWTMGQMKRPEASMYCCDSNAGELLSFNSNNLSPNNATLDLVGVDWRYSGKNTLMLFLDGHVDTIPEWSGLAELERDLGVRVMNLERKTFFTN